MYVATNEVRKIATRLSRCYRLEKRRRCGVAAFGIGIYPSAQDCLRWALRARQVLMLVGQAANKPNHPCMYFSYFVTLPNTCVNDIVCISYIQAACSPGFATLALWRIMSNPEILKTMLLYSSKMRHQRRPHFPSSGSSRSHGEIVPSYVPTDPLTGEGKN